MLALGIGLNSAMFSAVHAVILRPPDIPNAERLVLLREASSGQYAPMSWVNYQHWRNKNHTFDDTVEQESPFPPHRGRFGQALKSAGRGMEHMSGIRLLAGIADDADCRQLAVARLLRST